VEGAGHVTRALAALAFVVALAAAPGWAQEAAPQGEASRPAPAPRDDPPALEDAAKFLIGGAIGLGAHEAGHIIAGAALGADPGVKAIKYGPIPFFAISHDAVSPASEYTIAAAGFFVQHATSEWILSRRPGLRQTHAPFAKGMLAFNVMTSAVYATAAFGGFGPAERDTLAMAEALDVGEPVVGAMILAPAIADTWRYLEPDSKWAPWVSRALKVASVVAVIRAAQ
jgi:hypothetical protein